MALRPVECEGDYREAITNYRVLDSHGSAALVECTPETGMLVYLWLYIISYD